MTAGEPTTAEEASTFSSLSTYLVNFTLIAIIIYLIYKIFVQREPKIHVNREPSMPPMKKRDFTLEELREFDGKTREDGRILIAVNGKVFDVTKGKMHYGPQGPYSTFAGRDASRGLGTFSLEIPTDKYDDLSDLQPHEMESVLEWEMQFKEKYEYVGRLLKPGESHTCYSDEENESTEAACKSKDD